MVDIRPLISLRVWNSAHPTFFRTTFPTPNPPVNCAVAGFVSLYRYVFVPRNMPLLKLRRNYPPLKPFSQFRQMFCAHRLSSQVVATAFIRTILCLLQPIFSYIKLTTARLTLQKSTIFSHTRIVPNAL